MRLTADDVLDIEVPEHLRGYELENGELVEVSLPSAPHGRLCARVTRYLGIYLEEHGVQGEVYAETGYVLQLERDPERLRGPDISFVSAETVKAAGGEPVKGWFRLVPDLVVEVDSPDQPLSTNQKRIHDYLDAGVRVLWVIHTDTASATVYYPDGSARLLRRTESLEGEPVLPGFRLPLARLFPDEDEAR